MIRCDENALICDFAETYHVFNYRELPVKTMATLAVGLRDNSRIKLKMNKSKVDNTTLFLAAILDHLKMLVWLNSTDGQTGANRPKMTLNDLLGEETMNENGIKVFDSAESYEEYRKQIIERR